MAQRDPLSEAFGHAAPEHFDWQTRAPFVSDRERELVQKAFLPLRPRLLDLGCGEGATLVHLGEPAGAVGVDLFDEKLAFARRRLPRCQFVAASAETLPFDDDSFDQVIVRDVIHHLEEPEGALAEIRRVLAPGGRLDLLEPCGYNPLIALHAMTNRAERLELRSNERYLRRLVQDHLRIETLEHYQALPIHRLLFHPELGRPALADSPLACRLTTRFESLVSRLMPRWAWAYVHLRAVAES